MAFDVWLQIYNIYSASIQNSLFKIVEMSKLNSNQFSGTEKAMKYFDYKPKNHRITSLKFNIFTPFPIQLADHGVNLIPHWPDNDKALATDMIDVTIVRRACLLGVPLVLPEKYRKLVTYSHDVTRPSSQSTNKREKQAEPMSIV